MTVDDDFEEPLLMVVEVGGCSSVILRTCTCIAPAPGGDAKPGSFYNCGWPAGRRRVHQHWQPGGAHTGSDYQV